MPLQILVEFSHGCEGEDCQVQWLFFFNLCGVELCFPLHLFQTIQFRILVGKEFYFMKTFDGYELIYYILELITNTLSEDCLSTASS